MDADPRIDAYIARAAPFARPILDHLRGLVHRVLPQVEEGIKWGMPHFMIDGKNVAGMAAFKAHCAFTVHGEKAKDHSAMGHAGRITCIGDLPNESQLAHSLRAAAQRIEQTGSALKPREKPSPLHDSAVPDDFAHALEANGAAKEHFDSFAPSYRRDYLEWIMGAKHAETRARRIRKAVAQLAEGKRLHWKYEKS